MSTTTGFSTPATTFGERLELFDVSRSTARPNGGSNLANTLPYWLVNVPRTQWPADCPAFLQDLPAKSIAILSTPDEQYKRQDWETVKEIVRTNRIDRFQRLPSDLRKYLEFKAHVVAKYGSIMRFVVKKRLRWGEGYAEDLKPKGRPFECDDDIKILFNDWPYGVEEGIIHLVVWTKFELEDDPVTDDLTPQARKEIDDFVKKNFCSRVPAEQVIWFKNWRSLKSVHAVEHFHVMLYRPDIEFVKEITQGDEPLLIKA
ncbi:GIG1 family protein [Aspergillus clavatus NRRL 1]|uniref:N-acetylglucosamine-induced protein 1 n=1 Tax=Aspergillus clavatus (strain ATCC 1007 / CBS 513.65 / DSM 816 / NCTC 3887 / NRRL 1 / QM 1276 / 107) TaxID=344612 RepID=A1CET2_ASPCL|nr:uncharacterized protein ACLA_090740 [Aspergillus clavatus NRRL 1]EAW11381.1 conserved hypothetical protein [Aspergillus clavatus NRRL 1]